MNSINKSLIILFFDKIFKNSFSFPSSYTFNCLEIYFKVENIGVNYLQ